MPSLASSAPLEATDPLLGLAERLDPTPRDVFGILGYTPTVKQAEFHDATEFDVLYGGAAGGGKTKALLMHGLRAADRYPGLRIGAFRRTFDELEESFLKELQLIDYAEALGCRWNGGKYVLTFPNGSVIRFRYLQSVKDATRRQGGEYQLVLLDERTLIPPDAVSILVEERIRTSSLRLPVLGVRSASNPGGPGHGHCKTRYIDATDYGRNTITDDFGRTVRFIPAKVSDNPHLESADPGYVRRLDAIPDAARRAAMKDGSWDSFAGQFFTEWSHDRHVVPAFAVPKSWPRGAGMDWGYAAPHAVLWGAVHDGRLWIYRELYGTKVGEKELARRILDAEGARKGDLLARDPAERVRRWADPSMWNKVADAHPLAETFAAEGCHLLPATNDRLAGWQRLHTYLSEGPACEHHRAKGWDTCPMLHVLDGAAPNLVRTLPALPHDDKKVEDVDTDAEDHAPDALRYLVMALGVPHAKREAAKKPETPQERIAAQLDAKRKRAKHHPTLGA